MAEQVSVVKSKKILSSKDEIKSFMGNISDYIFAEYVRKGMPALYENRRWTANTENLEEWHKAYTRVQLRKMPPEEELIDENHE